jgi:glycosyltransferase involved in cell wall biosynthesis
MSPPERRILMTTDAVGGVWTYSTTLARALCGMGYAVTLVTLGPPPRPQQLAVLNDVRDLAIEITDLALEWMDPTGEDGARARNTLARIVQRAKPDLVHLNSYREALIGFEMPTIVVAHSCVGSWWEACRPGHRMEAQWRPYLERVGEALDAADAWVALTHACRRWIEQFYTPERPGNVIWNGTPPMSADAQKQPVILAAGRGWDEAKNLSALARVAPSLPWPVRIAGATKTEAGTEQRYEGVEQLGPLPHAQLIDEMRQAAVFVSPALYEPFGLGVLEAAANGCALVLSDIPTFRELWRDAALFTDPHDDTAIAHAIGTLCRDDELRRHLQHKAEKRARRYSLNAMASDYRELYDRLLLPPQRPAAAAAYTEARE